MLLNGLPQKRTDIILLFFRLHPSTAFRTLFFDHEGYYKGYYEGKKLVTDNSIKSGFANYPNKRY